MSFSLPAYEAATKSLAVADRSAQLRITFTGRAPEQILAGLVSGKIPAPYVADGPDRWHGQAAASTILTPKGRILSELRLLRVPPPAEGFLAIVPEACAAATLEHLRKVVPPRLAKVEDVSAATGMLTVVGPDAEAALRDLEITPPDAEGRVTHARIDEWGATAIRSGEVRPPGFDLLGSAEMVRAWKSALLARGAAQLDAETWDVLRVEAGTPVFGAELDDSVIPTEAGITPRVVDYSKGCFTGQEVLVRIRDRGHVNRLLRGLELGEVEPPARGAEIFRAGESRALGHITSAVVSPLFGQTIALGYVRREVEPPAELVLANGSTLRVRDLETWSPS
jgi:tRNA-modifying protein YgfZ